MKELCQDLDMVKETNKHQGMPRDWQQLGLLPPLSLNGQEREMVFPGCSEIYSQGRGAALQMK